MRAEISYTAVERSYGADPPSAGFWVGPRLPVTLASADAKASSDGRACDLPHSFSIIVCLSADAIDITAALARCAMSRTEAPWLLSVRDSAARAAGTGMAAT